MSNVRLSNGSPTLGRMDARLSDNPKSTACRSLFGQVDHEELKKDLKGRLQEMEEAASARWNFDFSSHKPLPNGRYSWMTVDDSPIFYRSASDVTDSCPSGNTNVDLNGNHNCVVVAPCKHSEEKDDRSENQMDLRDQCNGQRKRPACHDSTSQNKKPHTSLDDVSRCSGLTQAVEHTPRKPNPRTQT
ncbi:cyclin dependent kinase inhibitor 1Bb [Alosa pseudoharengus]|uniref:cyclin-dependent kinase inhibitor 1Bb n=1 Tax=Alosa sapidissima TaxID=34773 RepID=UPI001C085B8E|nr:cyclin-dependent kinase inhibitor 1Bb [Alosa sapidissima]